MGREKAMGSTFKRVTAIIVALAMSAGLCLGLAACSGGSATSDEDLIKAELDKGLSALKNPTEESLKTLLGDDMSSLDSIKEMGIDPIEMLQHLFSKFNYTIGDITVDGDTATAQVTMENVDVQTVMNETMANLQNDEDFIAKVSEAYASGNQEDMYKLIFDKVYEAVEASDKIVSNTVDLKLEKKDGQWTLDEEASKALVSSLYGGLDLSSM